MATNDAYRFLQAHSPAFATISVQCSLFLFIRQSTKREKKIIYNHLKLITYAKQQISRANAAAAAKLSIPKFNIKKQSLRT